MYKITITLTCKAFLIAVFVVTWTRLVAVERPIVMSLDSQGWNNHCSIEKKEESASDFKTLEEARAFMAEKKKEEYVSNVRLWNRELLEEGKR